MICYCLFNHYHTSMLGDEEIGWSVYRVQEIMKGIEI